MIEVLFILAGILAGFIAGLLPGIHPNTFAAFLLSASALLPFSPYHITLFLFSCAISNTFTNFIPSVFLGAPEDETALSVLPGHRFLLSGRGYEAIYLTVVGGMGVICLTVLLFPLLLISLPLLYSTIKNWIWLLLIFVAIFMIATDKRRFYAIIVFMLSGLLGIITLNRPLLPSSFMLFPIFSGLFGISTLLLSLKSREKIPKQDRIIVGLDHKSSFGAICRGWLAGLIMGVLPGLGASQAAVLVHEMKRDNLKSFLVSLGGVNTIACLISVLSLYIIQRPRSGIAIAIEKIILLDYHLVIILLFTSLFVCGIISLLTLKSASVFVTFLEKINYRMLSVFVILFLVILTAILTGWYGLFVLFVSTTIGILAPLFGVKRSHCMAVLMLPIITGMIGLLDF